MRTPKQKKKSNRCLIDCRWNGMILIHINCAPWNIAFCLFTATVKDEVLSGSPFHSFWLSLCTRGCCLWVCSHFFFSHFLLSVFVLVRLFFFPIPFVFVVFSSLSFCFFYRSISFWPEPVQNDYENLCVPHGNAQLQHTENMKWIKYIQKKTRKHNAYLHAKVFHTKCPEYSDIDFPWHKNRENSNRMS